MSEILAVFGFIVHLLLGLEALHIDGRSTGDHGLGRSNREGGAGERLPAIDLRPVRLAPILNACSVSSNPPVA